MLCSPVGSFATAFCGIIVRVSAARLHEPVSVIVTSGIGGAFGGRAPGGGRKTSKRVKVESARNSPEVPDVSPTSTHRPTRSAGFTACAWTANQRSK